LPSSRNKTVCVVVPLAASGPGGRKATAPVLADLARQAGKASVVLAVNNVAVDDDAWKIVSEKGWEIVRAPTTLTEPSFRRWVHSVVASRKEQIVAVVPPGAFVLDDFFKKLADEWVAFGDPAGALRLDAPPGKAGIGSSDPWAVGPDGAHLVAEWDPEGGTPAFANVGRTREPLVAFKAPSLFDGIVLDDLVEETPPAPAEPKPPAPASLRSRIVPVADGPRPEPPRPAPPLRTEPDIPKPPAFPPPPAPKETAPRERPDIAPGKASFLVATNRRPRLLRAALGLLVSQETPPGWRWDVMVGGEPGDPGEAIVREFPGVKWVDCPGPTVTTKLNALLAATAAELVLKADDDDLQPPDRLSAAAMAHENGALASGPANVIFYDLDNDRAMDWAGRATQGLIGTAMSFSTAFLRQVGGWPEQAKGEDGALMSRLRRARPDLPFVDLTGKMGVVVALQHGDNLYQRPVLEKGGRTSRGGFAVTGLGSLDEAGFAPAVRRAIQVVVRGISDGTKAVPPPAPAAPTLSFGEAPGLFTCVQGQFGQQAFVDGLKSVGFRTIAFEDAKAALAAGTPVLFHGWRDQYVQLGKKHSGLVAVLWHSGWTGSDLMGEGKALADALAAARMGTVRLFWLERRDVVPEGATPIAPVWSPDGLRAAAGTPRKRPRSVMVAFHGSWSAPCKNDLAGIVACAGIPGVELHLSKCAVDGPKAAVVREILRNVKHVVHEQLPREAAIRLTAEMEVVCHPSVSDTWPYSTLEAVHGGTPVVASDVVAWTASLPEWAHRQCIPHSATATAEIRALVTALLDDPTKRARLLEAQRSTLEGLAATCAEEFGAAVGKIGFPIHGVIVPKTTPTAPQKLVLRPPAPRKRPKIVMMPDVPDWAFGRIVAQVRKGLPDFNLETRYVGQNGRAAADEHAVLFYYHDHHRVGNPKQSAVCLYDFFSWHPEDLEEILPKFGAILVVNKTLRKIVENLESVKVAKVPVFDIPDGVDTSFFTPAKRIPRGDKLRAGWAGNLNWGGDWGKGDLKGVGLLEAVRERTADFVEWTIVDRTKNPVLFKNMPDIYRRLDVITCFSQQEGTPNPVLEGLAAGCLAVTPSVGLVPELVADGAVATVVERDVDAFVVALREAHESPDLLDRARKTNPDVMRRNWDWKVVLEKWRAALEYVEGLISGNLTGAVSGHWELCGSGGPDLSNEVTAFVTTVGAPDFPHCLDALAAQDCRFRLRVIDRVAPMSAAFQKMIDDCETPFYIQVDEDMILYPHAVRTMHERMLKEPDKTAILVHGLHDAFTGYNLTGIKIYRHSVIKKFPYAPQDFSCEVGQNERLQNAGFCVTVKFHGLDAPLDDTILGDVNAHWTPWGVFEKYFRDLQKMRQNPECQAWMTQLVPLFIRKFQKDPNNVTQFAFLGALVGLCAPLRDEGEKDFRVSRAQDYFDMLREVLQDDFNKAPRKKIEQVKKWKQS